MPLPWDGGNAEGTEATQSLSNGSEPEWNQLSSFAHCLRGKTTLRMKGREAKNLKEGDRVLSWGNRTGPRRMYEVLGFTPTYKQIVIHFTLTPRLTLVQCISMRILHFYTKAQALQRSAVSDTGRGGCKGQSPALGHTFTAELQVLF